MILEGGGGGLGTCSLHTPMSKVLFYKMHCVKRNIFSDGIMVSVVKSQERLFL